MKKLMFGLAVAGLCTAVSAVESQIVGYATKSAPKSTFRLATVSFQSVDGTYKIQDLLPMNTEVEYDEGDPEAFLTTAPHIQVQKADGDYFTYWYLKNAQYSDDGWETTKTKPGWADEWGYYCFPEGYNEDEPMMGDCLGPGVVTPGAAIWFKDQEKIGALLTNGQIDPKDVEIDCPTGFRLRGAAHPVEVWLNNPEQVTFSDLAEVEYDEGDPEAFLTTAPHIQVQKADGDYFTYWYLKNAQYSDDGWETTKTKPGWADEWGYYCFPEGYNEDEPMMGDCLGPATIPVTHGIWTKGVSKTFNMKFISPVK